MAAAEEQTAQADDETVAMQAATQRHGNLGSLPLRRLFNKEKKWKHR